LNSSKLFFAIQLCRINNPICLSNEIGKDLLNYIETNGLAPWLYWQAKNNESFVLDAPTLARSRQLFMENLLRNKYLTECYFEIQQILNSHGIPMVALKGLALAHCVYPDAALRQMGDIDVLVPEGLGLKANRILKDLGAKDVTVPRSSYHEQSSAHVRALMWKGVMVEVHQRLFSAGNRWNPPQAVAQRYFDGYNCNQVSTLPSEVFAYHIAAHAYYGFEMGGMRLAWLLDLALVLLTKNNLPQFLEQMYSINPKETTKLKNIVDWALIFTEAYDEAKFASLPNEVVFGQPSDIKKTHRWINFYELLRTPGLFNKAALLGYELFPSKEYMMYRYGDKGWKSYWKRLGLR
jgi:hypothetical protein